MIKSQIAFFSFSFCDHEPLHRTQSEEPPRSPFEVAIPSKMQQFYTFDLPQPQQQQQQQPSRASSRQSEIETISSENVATHSRNLSQDSAISYRSGEMSLSKLSQESVSMNFLHENASSTRPPSQEVSEFPLETVRCYETNSLPRQKCIHHKAEFHTFSLPRPDSHHHHHHHHQKPESYSHLESVELMSDLSLRPKRASISRDSSVDSSQHYDINARRYSHGATDGIVAYQRPNYPSASPVTHTLARRRLSYQQIRNLPSEDRTSTCDSETDSKQEQEIFIDFKPKISPVPSPRSKKKRLQKTLSEGEILIDKRRELGDGMPMSAASEEEIKRTNENMRKSNYFYSNIPIKDEGICDAKNLLKLPGDDDISALKQKREAYRKRSISLENPSIDIEDEPEPIPNKSAPPSPCPDELSVKGYSTYPSTDSLANDLTKDHSDGIWNESQATVLQADPT